MDIKGIIAIDCWDNNNLKSFYNNLDKKINFKDIESIIICNYEVCLDCNDVSLYNTLETYCWSECNEKILLPLIKEARCRQTSAWLKDKFSDNTFMLLDMYSVDYHITNCVPHIKDWLVIGGTYGGCTHSRPVNLKELPNLNANFYIAPWSMYDENEQDLILRKETIKKDTAINFTEVDNNYFLINK